MKESCPWKGTLNHRSGEHRATTRIHLSILIILVELSSKIKPGHSPQRGASSVVSGGREERVPPPPDSQKFTKKREKIAGKREKSRKIGKRGEKSGKRGKSGRKGKNQGGSFTLPLLTERATSVKHTWVSTFWYINDCTL